jgi:hypothetical protein
MLKRTEIGEHTDIDEETDLKEKIEITLRRLQELKERVAELKRRCEELRQMESEHSEHTEQKAVENKLRCDKCGHALDPEQQVAVKDSEGVERSHYHKECFQTLFK